MKSPSRLSYSSLSTYAECSMRWLIERGHKIGSDTWWATLAGTVVHQLTEDWDRGKASEDAVTSKVAFEMLLDVEAAKAAEEERKVRASGKVLKKHGKTGGPNKKDREWWLEEGPKMVQAYIHWRKLTRWEILTLWDGEPAIELQIDEPVAGRKFLGYVDRIFIRPTGEMVIVDIKSGKEPSGWLQLATYRLGILRKYGLDITEAAFWMAGDGDIPGLVDVERFNLDAVEGMVGAAWRGIEAGVFIPHVSSMCSGCGVRDYCPGVAGEKAGELEAVEVVEVNERSLIESVTQNTSA